MYEMAIAWIGCVTIVCVTVAKLAVAKFKLEALESRRYNRREYRKLEDDLSSVQENLHVIANANDVEPLKKDLAELKGKFNALTLRFNL
jgi:hypothetical protein